MSRPKPAIAVVLVNYRSGALAMRSLESLHASEVVASSGARGVESIVVDNASGGEDSAALARLATRFVANAENRGFAAAANQGAGLASADLVLFSNPDTLYAPGSLQALLDALERAPGAAAVGPRIFWDPERRFLLPPSDPPTLVEHVHAALAERSPRLARLRLRRWVRRALADWRATVPHAVPMLSGASLLVPRRALERIGGFDERFFLYFEDADWCRRARSAGLRLIAVPGAEITHFWNQSAAREAEAAAARFGESADAFFRKHHGAAAWRATAELAARIRRRDATVAATDLGELRAPPRFRLANETGERRLLLLSPLASCVPAVAHETAVEETAIPAEVWARIAPGPFHARLFSLPELRPLAAWRWRKPVTEGAVLERAS